MFIARRAGRTSGAATSAKGSAKGSASTDQVISISRLIAENHSVFPDEHMEKQIGYADTRRDHGIPMFIIQDYACR